MTEETMETNERCFRCASYRNMDRQFTHNDIVSSPRCPEVVKETMDIVVFRIIQRF